MRRTETEEEEGEGTGVNLFFPRYIALLSSSGARLSQR